MKKMLLLNVHGRIVQKLKLH